MQGQLFLQQVDVTKLRECGPWFLFLAIDGKRVAMVCRRGVLVDGLKVGKIQKPWGGGGKEGSFYTHRSTSRCVLRLFSFLPIHSRLCSCALKSSPHSNTPSHRSSPLSSFFFDHERPVSLFIAKGIARPNLRCVTHGPSFRDGGGGMGWWGGRTEFSHALHVCGRYICSQPQWVM